MEYYVYILESVKSGKYYIGQTENLEERVAKHNAGRNLSTRHDIPWQLKWWKEYETRSEAIKVEIRIKEIKKRKGIEKYIEKNKFRGIAQSG